MLSLFYNHALGEKKQTLVTKNLLLMKKLILPPQPTSNCLLNSNTSHCFNQSATILLITKLISLSQLNRRFQSYEAICPLFC